MIDGIVSGEVYQILNKALNASQVQHQLISNNIANIDTPGFKRSEVVFQSKLDSVLNNREKNYMPLKLTDVNHIPIAPRLSVEDINHEVIMRTETSLRNDGNNVDVDYEMAKMAENTVYYTSVAQLMSSKLSLLQSVINDGRR